MPHMYRMKLPSGTPIIRGEPIKNPEHFASLLQKAEHFNGYIGITGMGYDGMEDGVLLVDNGSVTHAYYLHLKYIYEDKGDSALKKVLNIVPTGTAVVDFVEFTIPKLKLTVSFNEAFKLSKSIPLKDVPKMVPKVYDYKHVITIIRTSDMFERIKRMAELGLTHARREDL